MRSINMMVPGLTSDEVKHVEVSEVVMLGLELTDLIRNRSSL
jgi:hypothetical protein